MKILNQSEARAVFDAMCALNNVDAKLESNLRGGDICVKENIRGEAGEATAFEGSR